MYFQIKYFACRTDHESLPGSYHESLPPSSKGPAEPQHAELHISQTHEKVAFYLCRSEK